jgi:preprotein translocase subunit SecD
VIHFARSVGLRFQIASFARLIDYSNVKAKPTSFGIIFAATFACLLLFTLTGCNRPPAHGNIYVIQIETNGLTRIDDALLLERKRILSNRLRTLGVYAVVDQLPGARLQIKTRRLSPTDAITVRQTISAGGRLEFRLVHPESHQLVADSIIEPGYEILRQNQVQPNGQPGTVGYLVKKQPELTGKHITKAMVTRNPVTREPQIGFELDSEGAKIFEKLTTEYSPKGNRYFQLAIVIDKILYSAPRILGPIAGGRGQITGSFSAKEALGLANLLENPVEPPHRIIEENIF